MDKQQLDIATAAEIMGVSEKTVRRLVKAGQLAAVKVDTPTGFVYRLDPEAVEQARVARGQTAVVPVQAEDRLRRVVIEAVGQPLEQLGIKLAEGQAAWVADVQASVQGLGDVVSLRETLAEVRAEAARIAQERDEAQRRADALQDENQLLRDTLDAERSRPLTARERLTGRKDSSSSPGRVGATPGEHDGRPAG